MLNSEALGSRYVFLYLEQAVVDTGPSEDSLPSRVDDH